MVSQNLTLRPDWQQQADQFIFSANYHQAAQLYEQAIAAAPQIKYYYWHLGLILLLEGQEIEAQTTWLLAMTEGESEEIDMWTAELVEVLQAEAERQELEVTNYSVAWAIRQHLREINPTEINNVLHLIKLSILLGTYTGEELRDLGVIELFQSEPQLGVDSDLLVQVWKQSLDRAPFHPSLFDLTEACLPYVKEPLLFIVYLSDFLFSQKIYSRSPFH
jgi:tetratricopeptide (TPR) repeat protein